MYRNVIAAVLASSSVAFIGAYLEEENSKIAGSFRCTVTATNKNGDTQEFSAFGSPQSTACKKAEEKAEKWCGEPCTIDDCVCTIFELAKKVPTKAESLQSTSPVFSCRITCLTKTSNRNLTSTAQTQQAAWNNLLRSARAGGGIVPGSVKVTFIPRFVGRATGSVYCIDTANDTILDYAVSGTDSTGTSASMALEALAANASRIEEAASAAGWRCSRLLSPTVEQVEHFFAKETTVAVTAEANNGRTIYVSRRAFTAAEALAAATARAEAIADENNGLKVGPAQISLNTLP